MWLVQPPKQRLCSAVICDVDVLIKWKAECAKYKPFPIINNHKASTSSNKRKHIQSVKPPWKDRILRVCTCLNNRINTTKKTRQANSIVHLLAAAIYFYVFMKVWSYDLRFLSTIQMCKIKLSIWIKTTSNVYKDCRENITIKTQQINIQAVTPFSFCTLRMFHLKAILKSRCLASRFPVLSPDLVCTRLPNITAVWKGERRWAGWNLKHVQTQRYFWD